MVLAAVLLVVGGLAWGLTSSFATSAPPSPASGKVILRLGWTSEPDNLNPFIGYADDTYEIWALNYSYLFGSGNYNQPTLDLASEFPTQQNGGISANGKIWTIHIRPNVRWQDGVPLTAADVAFTYNYIIKNDMTNLTIDTQGIKSVRALNPTTVQFTCFAPKADFEKATVPILPEHIWSHVSPKVAATSYSVKLPLVGSGPFQTVAFVKGSYLKMVRNPYWYGQKPTIDEIYFEMYENPQTMASDLKTGTIDGADGLAEAAFKQLQSTPGIKTAAFNYYMWDYLEFNCYDKPSSMGNPVCRDWRFRNALNWAIDRQKLCDLAYDNLATPGTTIIPPHTFANPDYHWQPPADQLYSFDLAKASQLLTASGYPLKNGQRLDKQGKPIVLRLMTTTSWPQGLTEAKLVTGWLQQLGLKIKLEVVDNGAYESAVYNESGNTWKPDFDMTLWDWGSYYDPGLTLACLTTHEIGALDEPFWSNAQYDALNTQQSQTIDPQKRQQIIWHMQQIMYQQSPWIVITYSDDLQAFNTSRWTGWTQMFGGTGPAWNCEGNYASYLSLRPKVVAASSGSNRPLIIAGGIVVAVVAVGVALGIVVRRRRRRTEET